MFNQLLRGYVLHTRFTMTTLWIKHMWKAWKIFTSIFIATLLRIIIKKHMTIIYEKYLTVSNLYFSMTSNDFQRLFQAKWHFSRPTSNSMTFQGKLKIPWLFQARMNQAYCFSEREISSFSWLKMCKFRLRFHWSLFPRVQLIIFRHWFR